MYCIYFAIPKSGSSVLVALATDKRNDFICTSWCLRFRKDSCTRLCYPNGLMVAFAARMPSMITQTAIGSQPRRDQPRSTQRSKLLRFRDPCDLLRSALAATSRLALRLRETLGAPGGVSERHGQSDSGRESGSPCPLAKQLVPSLSNVTSFSVITCHCANGK